jgi:ribosomal protein L21
MYAVIGSGAGQLKVEEGQRVHVDLLDAQEGDEVTLPTNSAA